MNTREDLIALGLEDLALSKIIESQQKHIGELHGVNRITDITYLGVGEGSVIELTCTECGNVRTKNYVSGRNRWCELAKTCSCQKRVLSEKEKAVRKEYNNAPENVGKVFGNLTVVEIIATPKQTQSGKIGKTVKWLCECSECHGRRVYVPSEVKSGVAKCKCSAKRQSKYIGVKFGRLTVKEVYKKDGNSRFICEGDCGEIYDGFSTPIVRGKVLSCGCLAREIHENAKSQSPLWHTWSGMISRCENVNNQSWNDYGGRGISVCEEWHDFKKFEEWAIGNGYRPGCGLSLDRIDVNGNYEPSNCRYTTSSVQLVNRRPRKPNKKSLVTINGVTKTKREWCEEYGIWDATVNYRIKHMGMTFEEALVAEKKRSGNHNPVTVARYKEEQRRLAELNKINSFIECNLYMAFCRITDRFVLQPQVQVGNYRVDFMVDGMMIVVECDGYDQHKTKEQMAKDYKRERYLVSQGYTVIRFTGSEINKDPDGCAKELFEMIKTIGGAEWQGQAKIKRTV